MTGRRLGVVVLMSTSWPRIEECIKVMDGAIGGKTVTHDFERLMEGAKLVGCSQFGKKIIGHM